MGYSQNNDRATTYPKTEVIPSSSALRRLTRNQFSSEACHVTSRVSGQVTSIYRPGVVFSSFFLFFFRLFFCFMFLGRIKNNEKPGEL